MLGGVTCVDFDSDIYTNTLDAILPAATFSESVCVDATELTDEGTIQIEVTTEITMPLVETRVYDDDSATVLYHVSTIVTAAVSDGSFESQLLAFAAAAGRRLDMTSITVEGVSIDT